MTDSLERIAACTAVLGTVLATASVVIDGRHSAIAAKLLDPTQSTLADPLYRIVPDGRELFDKTQPPAAACLGASRIASNEFAEVQTGRGCLRPGDVFRDCSDVCPEMVVLPPGTFVMGSPPGGRQGTEGPAHPVSIDYHFAVSRFVVTVAQYAAFVDETRRSEYCLSADRTPYRDRKSKSFRNPGFDQTRDHPAVCISQADAQDYLVWLGRKTGHAYRLLSEAEWEYAARAGSQRAFWFLDDVNKRCDFVNGADQSAQSRYPSIAGSACTDGYMHTAPVGAYVPNDFGLHEMVGNVWQLTADRWNRTYDGAPQTGEPWTGGGSSFWVLRGGSWQTGQADLRLTARKPGGANPYFDVGLRLAVSLE